MAYEKQTWTTGEVITADKLNHMEDGISGAGGGALIVNIDMSKDPAEMDKTWQEIKDAGANVLFQTLADFEGEPYYSFYPYITLWQLGPDYIVVVANVSGQSLSLENYVADSPTGILRRSVIS